MTNSFVSFRFVGDEPAAGLRGRVAVGVGGGGDEQPRLRYDGLLRAWGDHVPPRPPRHATRDSALWDGRPYHR